MSGPWFIASYREMEVAGRVIALMGKVGDGVLGPREEAAEVNDDCEPECEATEDAREFTLGEQVPEE
jgi:hypothetical protein